MSDDEISDFSDDESNEYSDNESSASDDSNTTDLTYFIPDLEFGFDFETNVAFISGGFHTYCCEEVSMDSEPSSQTDITFQDIRSFLEAGQCIHVELDLKNQPIGMSSIWMISDA